MVKALNVEAKEEKTEISCMLCMQDQVDELTLSGVDMTNCPFGEMVAAASAEQPPCASYLRTIALFVKECGCNGDLLRELDAFTKVRATSTPPLPTLVAAAAALQDTTGTVRPMGSEFIAAVTNLAVKSSPLRVPYTCMALMKAQLISPVEIDGRCALLTAKHVKSLLSKDAMIKVRAAEGLMKQARELLSVFGDQARPRNPRPPRHVRYALHAASCSSRLAERTVAGPRCASWRRAFVAIYWAVAQTCLKDHAAFVALSELDVRCGKFLTNRRNVECTGEDYENISDIAKELAVANVRTFVGGWGRGGQRRSSWHNAVESVR